jgi:hypothetical protein
MFRSFLPPTLTFALVAATPSVASLSQGWSAGITTWLPRACLGVWPVDPGLGPVSIRADLVDLPGVSSGS